MAIWFTSDLHFNHDKPFIYAARGFENITDMNNAIIKNWQTTVQPDDEIYILGDLMLGQDMDAGIRILKMLNGKKHIILGNHDTDKRRDAYVTVPSVVDINYGCRVRYNGYTIMLSHYPMLTANGKSEFNKRCVLNFFGHTHQKGRFLELLEGSRVSTIYTSYNVGMDAHNCTPVQLETILTDIEAACS